MTAEAFIAAVQAIAEEKPSYRIGGTGADGTCDCIGLVMGALQRISPVTFPLHSSNYFARKEMASLEEAPAANLEPGMLVFKARADNGSLHERYREGGQYCNGDPLDYYHAGVVLSAEPLQIVHCTSGDVASGIVYDTSLRPWSHAGRLRSIAYGQEGEPDEPGTTATVCTPDGNPLHLRSTPDTSKPYIAKLPNGDTVTLLAEAEGWAKVCWQGQTGYCMSRYLQMPKQDSEPVPQWGMQVLSLLEEILHLLGGEASG